MIVGETVTVERRQEVGRDPGNNPLWEWVPETVDGVLVAPGSRTDVEDSTRPDGVEVKFTLHFPKGYPETLANARISVRGRKPMTVVGDPSHYTEANTPGEWSMPVEIGTVEG